MNAWNLCLLLLCIALPLHAQALPPELQQAATAARLPTQALAAWVVPVTGGEPRLAWRADELQNPASLAKLATSLAALERLGPAWRWQTPVWLRGRLDPALGRLEGDVLIAGSGDPSLVLERVWLMLRRLQQLGVREISGDFLLDRSAFAPSPVQPGDFDGEPWRPGNVQPDALLLNFKSLNLLVRPDPARAVAWLSAEIPLVQASVPLKTGVCRDARAQLRANWQLQPGLAEALRLDGHWPSACGEQRWPIADPDPAGHNARLLQAVWRELGGRLQGRVREGLAPTGEAPSFEWSSPPLAELLRDLNKNSSNIMAEQLALTLSLQAGERPATLAGAQALIAAWLQQRLGWTADSFVWDRGSGLSRQTRLSARQLGQLLAAAWASPFMPEFLASLPIAGVDGTLAREPSRFGAALGRSHLKTGSLRDVQAVAGYVQARSGQRYIVVGMIQHPRAAEGRPVLDALLRWVAED